MKKYRIWEQWITLLLQRLQAQQQKYSTREKPNFSLN